MPQEDKIEFILPFEGMSVGDSFFVPSLKPAELLYIIDTRAKIAGVRVKCFVTSSEGYMGVRVWRTR